MLIICPDPFISQSSPDHSPQPRVDFSWNLGTRHLFSYLCALDLDKVLTLLRDISYQDCVMKGLKLDCSQHVTHQQFITLRQGSRPIWDFFFCFFCARLSTLNWVYLTCNQIAQESCLLFLTAISHRGLRNCFFFWGCIYFFHVLSGLLVFFSLWNFIFLFYLDFYPF